MAKINLLNNILGLEGDVVKDADGTDFTLKKVCVRSLLSQADGEKNIKPEDKLKRYQLAMKVNDAGGIIELKIEEVAELKKAIGRIFSPLIMGRAYDMLEGTNERQGKEK